MNLYLRRKHRHFKTFAFSPVAPKEVLMLIHPFFMHLPYLVTFLILFLMLLIQKFLNKPLSRSSGHSRNQSKRSHTKSIFRKSPFQISSVNNTSERIHLSNIKLLSRATSQNRLALECCPFYVRASSKGSGVKRKWI